MLTIPLPAVAATESGAPGTVVVALLDVLLEVVLEQPATKTIKAREPHTRTPVRTIAALHLKFSRIPKLTDNYLSVQHVRALLAVAHKRT